MTEVIKKWRDFLIDPMKIPFKNIILDKIISYPYAGNDVFECVGKYKNKNINFFLKIEKSKKANFDNEVHILKLLKNKLPVPKVLEYGKYEKYKYIILSKLEGNKLSNILKTTNDKSGNYLFNYGNCLATIHNLEIKTDIAMQRSINDYPDINHYKDLSKEDIDIINYLKDNKPDVTFDTFIHGDFHYGNILWEDKKINGIIDLEYAGMGFKEQDIAWSLILRPPQEFLYSIDEIKLFLKGYKKAGNYDFEKLRWCLVNGYMQFYLMNKKNNDDKYLKRLIKLINIFISIKKENEL